MSTHQYINFKQYPIYLDWFSLNFWFKAAGCVLLLPLCECPPLSGLWLYMSSEATMFLLWPDLVSLDVVKVPVVKDCQYNFPLYNWSILMFKGCLRGDSNTGFRHLILCLTFWIIVDLGVQICIFWDRSDKKRNKWRWTQWINLLKYKPRAMSNWDCECFSQFWLLESVVCI